MCYNWAVMAQKDILPPIQEDDRMLSGLVYPLWPLLVPIILYGSKQEEPYLHFNALQALALGVFSLVGSLLILLVSWLTMYLLPGSSIAVSGTVGLVLFGLLVFMACFYLTFIIFVAWRVVGGKFLRLPFLGKWAEKRMQRNLNLTEDSYSSDIIGEHYNVKLSHFDYRNAPGYVEEEIEPVNETDIDERYYNPETGDYEYVGEAASAEDILAYEKPSANPAAPAPSAAKPSVTPTAAKLGGFQPHIPGSAPKPSAPEPKSSDGFKPLSYQFGTKRPGSSPDSFGTATTIDNGSFKPLAPQSARKAPEPVVAGRPVASSEFKPLVPQGQQSAPARTRTAPKFQWQNDFSANAPKAPSPSAGPTAPSQPRVPNSASDNSSFKPGIMANKGTRSNARFRWDELEDK